MSQQTPAATGAHLELTRAQRLYIWLTAISCACLLIGDVVGIKLFRIPLHFEIPVWWGDGKIVAIEHTCGMLTFPVTFLLTDLINEFYGKKAARRVAFISLAMGLLAFAVINASQYMPRLDAPYNVSQESFDAIFGSAKGMYIASMCAYIVGQLSDIAIFGLLKKATGGKMIWLRATGSTVISQFIDSFVVSVIAFNVWRTVFRDPTSPPAPMGEIFKLALTGYMLKFVLAMCVTPLIYLGHTIVRKFLGLQPLPPDDTV